MVEVMPAATSQLLDDVSIMDVTSCMDILQTMDVTSFIDISLTMSGFELKPSPSPKYTLFSNRDTHLPHEILNNLVSSVSHMVPGPHFGNVEFKSCMYSGASYDIIDFHKNTCTIHCIAQAKRTIVLHLFLIEIIWPIVYICKCVIPVSCLDKCIYDEKLTPWPVDSPHKGPVMQKAFPCHDITMLYIEPGGDPSVVLHIRFPAAL